MMRLASCHHQDAEPIGICMTGYAGRADANAASSAALSFEHVKPMPRCCLRRAEVGGVAVVDRADNARRTRSAGESEQL
jgi:hypothetical protein